MMRRKKTNIQILLTLTVSVLAVGCTGSSIYIEPEGDIPTTLLKSSGIFHHAAEPVQVVIRSPEDWEAFLSNYPTRSLEYARHRFWHVDYDRHMVVGLALGTRGSGSISVNIDSIRIENRRVRVYATEHRPAIQTRDMANPAHFVVMDRIDWPVEFAAVELARGEQQSRRR